MKKIFFILACIFGLGITAEVLSQAGGFPSSPTFQTVTVAPSGTTQFAVNSDGGVTAGFGATDEGSGTFNALTLYAKNIQIGRVVFATIVQGSSSCSISGSFENYGINACSYVSAGTSTFTIVGAYGPPTTNQPVCVATPITGEGGAVNSAVTTTSSTSGTLVNTVSGAGTNETVNVMCVGL